MAKLRFEITTMLRKAGIRKQMMEAVTRLTNVLDHTEHAAGKAYKICDTWQRRFELALRNEILDWIGLAGFRLITDFTIPGDRVRDMFPPRPANGKNLDKNELEDFEQCWQAYEQYFQDESSSEAEKNNSKNRESGSEAGKYILKGEVADYFRSQLHRCDQTLGGQAGNILWLWLTIGASPYGVSGSSGGHLAF